MNAQPDAQAPVLLKVAEVAELLRVGPDKVRELMADGELPYVAISRFVRRIPHAAVLAYIARQTVTATPEPALQPAAPRSLPTSRRAALPDRRTGVRGPWRRDRFRPKAG